MEPVENILKEIREIGNTTAILKDTLEDQRKTNKRLMVTIWVLIAAVVGMYMFGNISGHIAQKASDERFYNFWDQFEFVEETTITHDYTQDGNISNDGDINQTINPKE